MTNIQAIIAAIFFSTFIGVLIYFMLKEKEKLKNHNTIIYTEKYRWRTDKVDTTDNGIRFIDTDGDTVFIKGHYIIERHAK